MGQKQTVLNLHNAEILPEVIAMQLDISKEQVVRIITYEDPGNKKKNKDNKKMSIKQASEAPPEVPFISTQLSTLTTSSILHNWKCGNL